MSNTPHRAAYLALLCLPHDKVRSSLQVQGALAVLRDHLAATDGQDPEALQSTFESISFLMTAQVQPVSNPPRSGAVGRAGS